MSKDEMVGRTRSNITCVFPGGEELVGSLVKVKVHGSSPNTLKGDIAL